LPLNPNIILQQLKPNSRPASSNSSASHFLKEDLHKVHRAARQGLQEALQALIVPKLLNRCKAAETCVQILERQLVAAK